MSVVALVARASDGFVLSSSDKTMGREVTKQCKSLLHHQNLLLKQVSLESGQTVYHFQKGSVISVIFITPATYSAMEAYSRIGQIEDTYLMNMGEERIQRAHTLLNGGSEQLREILQIPFDEKNALSCGELPPRQNISVLMEKIKGQPFGFSTRVLKKKKTVVLEWKEIGLLVPLTLIAFFKTIVAIKVGGPITVASNFVSTVVSFYLVFICVHDLLTTKRLILSSFLLLMLTYGTTVTSLTSIVFNGIFALLTLGNVAHYYLKPLRSTGTV